MKQDTTTKKGQKRLSKRIKKERDSLSDEQKKKPNVSKAEKEAEHKKDK